MKVRASLKSLKEQPGAQVVRRRGRVFVINKQNPRFMCSPSGNAGQYQPLDSEWTHAPHGVPYRPAM